jgi:hypothetical protein
VDVGRAIPTGRLQLEKDCARNKGKLYLRRPIVRRLMPTAKTTLLPANDKPRAKMPTETEEDDQNASHADTRAGAAEELCDQTLDP